MRIAIAGVSVENLAQSPLFTDHENMQIYRGPELLEKNLWLIRGMVARLRETVNVEICPLLWATALPGGPLTHSVYQAIKQETLAMIAAQGPFDGVLLANHGALEAEGLATSADADFIMAVREAIGPDTPLGIAFDLHGNLTPEIIQAGTVFSALRTAPHRDDPETGYRVADQLLRVIERGLKPQTALVRVPILAIGEATVTTFEPMKSLYASLPELDQQPGVMQSIIMVGFAFNDKPWVGMSTLVTTENNPALAQELAEDLARKVWDARHDYTYKMETAGVAEGLARAVEGGVFPTYLSDAGDNTTAGAPGDLTVVLQQALVSGIKDAVFAGITAPQTVQRCREAGVGAQIEIVLGAEHISASHKTMTVAATVEAFGDVLELGGFQPYRTTEGAWARVHMGGVLVTFHELPIGITTPHHFTGMGINPVTHRLYIVKEGYLHPQLEDVARRHIMLYSSGLTPLDLHQIPWQHVPRPIFPLDPEMTWHP